MVPQGHRQWSQLRKSLTFHLVNPWKRLQHCTERTIIKCSTNSRVKKWETKKASKLQSGWTCWLKLGAAEPVPSQECPNGASVFRGLWTITALAKSASSKLKSLSLSSRKGSDVVRMNGGQLLWERATKSWTSMILFKKRKEKKDNRGLN